MAYVSTPFLLPFCTPDGTGGSDPYFVGLSKDDVVKWYWRVRTWNASWSYSWGPVPITGSFSEDSTEIVTTESDLVCAQLFQTLQFGLEDDGLFWVIFCDTGDGPCIFADPLYYPNMCNFTATKAGNYGFGLTPSFGDPCGTGEIDGNTVQLYGNGAGGTALTITGFSLSAKTYWPYNTSSGDIYDGSTGAQLINPFSVQSP